MGIENSLKSYFFIPFSHWIKILKLWSACIKTFWNVGSRSGSGKKRLGNCNTFRLVFTIEYILKHRWNTKDSARLPSLLCSNNIKYEYSTVLYISAAVLKKYIYRGGKPNKTNYSTTCTVYVYYRAQPNTTISFSLLLSQQFHAKKNCHSPQKNRILTVCTYL